MAQRIAKLEQAIAVGKPADVGENSVGGGSGGLALKADKDSVVKALLKKASKSSVEQIAKEVSETVASLDAGLKAITDTMNKKTQEL